MKILRSVISALTSKNFFPILLILVFAALASRHLLFERGYFMMHDDLQMMRQLEMEKCFEDGQIPCRWVPDMAYGYGFPLFNFYPPLPYLVGQIFRVLGFSFVETVKLTFTSSIFLSGIFMYLMAKHFFGRIGGLMSAVFYVWAPYHSVDVFVRGAMNESWALTWFPLICYSTLKLIESKNIYKQFSIRKFMVSDNFKYVLMLAFSWTALLLSHNLMVLIFVPIFGIFTLLILWQKSAWKKIPLLAISGMWAFGMAAFFTIPALLENKFTQVESVLIGYYDYTAHFISISQLLFTRFWGYGPSVWGVESDGMPFQIGHLHWGLSILIVIGLVYAFIKNIKNIFNYLKNNSLVTITLFFILVGWATAFMTHQKSAHVWLLFPQLKYLQFPWRFLTLTTFAFSFAVGIIPGAIAKWKNDKNLLSKILVTPGQLGLTILICAFLVVLNWAYFSPDGGRNGAVTDESKFTGLAWELQQTAGIYDYLPKTSKIAPNGARRELTEIMSGEVKVDNVQEGTNWVKFKASVGSENAKIRVNILDFPDWKIFANGQELQTYIPEEELFGRFWIDLPKGEYEISAKLYNTPVRTNSNIISLLSTVIFGFMIIWRRKYAVNDEK